jgi:hypothetical protein
MLAYIHKQAFLLSTFGAYDNQRLPYACFLCAVGFLSVLAYLCHPFYLCLLISKHKATKGEIEGEKASTRQPFLSHLHC